MQTVTAPRNRLLSLAKKYSATVILFAALFLFWEYGVPAMGIPDYLLPTPSTINRALLENYRHIPVNTLVTVEEIILGFVVGSGIGILIGVGVAYSKAFEKIVYPVAIFIRSAPMIAIAPILVLWFGAGITSKIVIVALVAFFPLVVNTAIGIKSVEPSLLDLLKSLSATEMETFVKVRIPWSLPYIFAGLKIAMAVSVTSAVVAEFVVADKGLGYMVMISLAYTDTARIFVVLGLLASIALSLFVAVTLMERILAPWASKTES